MKPSTFLEERNAYEINQKKMIATAEEIVELIKTKSLTFDESESVLFKVGDLIKKTVIVD